MGVKGSADGSGGASSLYMGWVWVMQKSRLSLSHVGGPLSAPNHFGDSRRVGFQSAAHAHYAGNRRSDSAALRGLQDAQGSRVTG